MDSEVTKFFEELTKNSQKSPKKETRNDEEPRENLRADGASTIERGEPVASLAEENSFNVDAELAKSGISIKTDKPEKYSGGLGNFDGSEGQLTIDVFENKDEIVVESTIAGVRPEDLDINIAKDSVVIRGKRERERKVRDENFLYQECYWGKFSRTVILPQEVDPDNAQASLKNGILTIRMPKAGAKGRAKKLRVGRN